jgi:hypothetical protein
MNMEKQEKEVQAPVKDVELQNAVDVTGCRTHAW